MAFFVLNIALFLGVFFFGIMIKKILILFCLGVVFLALCFKYFDLSGTLAHYRNINFWYLPLFFVTLGLTTYLRGTRWSYLLKKLLPVKRKEVIQVYMMGSVIDFLIPVRIAELVKCNYIKRRYRLPISKVLPTVMIDKLFDLTPILVLLLVMPFLQYKISANIFFVVYFLVGMLAFGVLFLVVVSFRIGLVIKARQRVKNRKVRKILAMFLRFAVGIRKLKFSFTLFVKMFGLSLLAIFFNCVAFYICVLTLGLSIPFAVILLGYSLLFLSYAAPSPPGQMGSNEIMALLIFSGMFALADNMVAAVIILAHFLVAMYLVLLGLVLFKTFRHEVVLSLAFFSKKSKKNS